MIFQAAFESFLSLYLIDTIFNLIRVIEQCLTCAVMVHLGASVKINVILFA